MNREILFRGKSIHDKNYWIYGGAIHQTDYYGERVDRWFIVDGTETHDYDIGEPYEADPATAGQWTGLTDRTGKRIFEGDILRESEPEDPSGEYLPVFGHVCFGEYHNTFDGGGEAHIGFFVEWKDNEDDDYSKTFRKDLGYWAKYPYCEVRGNIHDHPELLKGETKNGEN